MFKRLKEAMELHEDAVVQAAELEASLWNIEQAIDVGLDTTELIKTALDEANRLSKLLEEIGRKL